MNIVVSTRPALETIAPGDPVRRYIEACAALEFAERHIEVFVRPIVLAGRALEQSWRGLALTNLPLAFPDRAHLLTDAREWPTAEELGDALAEAHAALNRVQTAWDGIPEAMRIGIEPPPPAPSGDELYRVPD